MCTSRRRRRALTALVSSSLDNLRRQFIEQQRTNDDAFRRRRLRPIPSLSLTAHSTGTHDQTAPLANATCDARSNLASASLSKAALHSCTECTDSSRTLSSSVVCAAAPLFASSMPYLDDNRIESTFTITTAKRNCLCSIVLPIGSGRRRSSSDDLSKPRYSSVTLEP